MDWKTVGNYVLVVGMVSMFNQVNGRLDTMQAETSRRFDATQAENARRFDTMQAENQRQRDAIEEMLRVFEGRVTRLEEKAGIGPDAE